MDIKISVLLIVVLFCKILLVLSDFYCFLNNSTFSRLPLDSLSKFFSSIIEYETPKVKKNLKDFLLFNCPRIFYLNCDSFVVSYCSLYITVGSLHVRLNKHKIGMLANVELTSMHFMHTGFVPKEITK